TDFASAPRYISWDRPELEPAVIPQREQARELPRLFPFAAELSDQGIAGTPKMLGCLIVDDAVVDGKEIRPPDIDARRYRDSDDHFVSGDFEMADAGKRPRQGTAPFIELRAVGCPGANRQV